MNKHYMFLQLFAGEEAAAEPAGGGTETAAVNEAPSDAPFSVGDTLRDGSQVADARVAAALNRQMKRHPELRQVYARNPAQPMTPQAPAGQPVQTPDNTPNEPGTDLEAEFNELVHGKYKDIYGQRVKSAIMDRLKNQSDARAEMDSWRPVIDALKKRSEVTDDQEFRDMILNDESDLEQEAEERGMTAEALKELKAIEAENAQYKAEKEQAENRAHFQKLYDQCEELKKVYPSIDFFAEMQNPDILKWTHPSVGMSFKQAYLAVHGEELQTQAVAYGMNRTREQMAQTIQAQRARPAEGAMSGKSQAAAAEPKLNPANMTPQERKKFKDYVKRYGAVSFDR